MVEDMDPKLAAESIKATAMLQAEEALSLTAALAQLSTSPKAPEGLKEAHAAAGSLAAPGTEAAAAPSNSSSGKEAPAASSQAAGAAAGNSTPEASVPEAGSACTSEPSAAKRTPSHERFVFFAKVPPCVPASEVLQLFSSCGRVVAVNLFKPWATSKTSKGCGTVEFVTREEAAAAIQRLNGISHWVNAQTSLIVEPVHATAALPPESHARAEEDVHLSVFFAKVPPCVPASEVLEVFSACGTVASVNLFKPWANSKTSKGCGVVKYATKEGAAAAIQKLNGLLIWTNAKSPLHVEPLDPNRKPRGAPPHGPMFSSNSSSSKAHRPLRGSRASFSGTGAPPWMQQRVANHVHQQQLQASQVSPQLQLVYQPGPQAQQQQQLVNGSLLMLPNPGQPDTVWVSNMGPAPPPPLPAVAAALGNVEISMVPVSAASSGAYGGGPLAAMAPPVQQQQQTPSVTDALNCASVTSIPVQIETMFEEQVQSQSQVSGVSLQGTGLQPQAVLQSQLQPYSAHSILLLEGDLNPGAAQAQVSQLTAGHLVQQAGGMLEGPAGPSMDASAAVMQQQLQQQLGVIMQLEQQMGGLGGPAGGGVGHVVAGSMHSLMQQQQQSQGALLQQQQQGQGGIMQQQQQQAQGALLQQQQQGQVALMQQQQQGQGGLMQQQQQGHIQIPGGVAEPGIAPYSGSMGAAGGSAAALGGAGASSEETQVLVMELQPWLARSLLPTVQALMSMSGVHATLTAGPNGLPQLILMGTPKQLAVAHALLGQLRC